MKNKDLYEMYKKIDELKDKEGFKFAYALAKNKKIIEAEIELLQPFFNQLNQEEQTLYEEYNNKRLNIINKYSSKFDENLKDYLIDPDKVEDLKKEIKILNEEYLFLIKTVEKFEKNNLEILDKECKIELYKLDSSDVPSNVCMKDIEPLMYFIK